MKRVTIFFRTFLFLITVSLLVFPWLDANSTEETIVEPTPLYNDFGILLDPGDVEGQIIESSYSLDESAQDEEISESSSSVGEEEGQIQATADMAAQATGTESRVPDYPEDSFRGKNDEPATQYDVNMFTGALQTSLPIIVPPGRGGLAPQIALSYSSRGGNSWVGTGWNLSPGAINRSTASGIPDYANTDEFELNGTPLVDISSNATGFRSEIEASFSRIQRPNGANYWVVLDKGGTELRFGASSATRVWRNSNTFDETFQWALDRITDPNGNTINITYTKSNNFLYPSQISYNDGHSTVEFATETLPHSTSNARAGFIRKTDRRLKSILTKVDGSRARKYILGYSDTDDDPSHVLSHLVSVRECGSDTSDTSMNNCLPLTEFEYQRLRDGFSQNHAAYDGPEGAMSHRPGDNLYLNYIDVDDHKTLHSIVDIHPDGLPDILVGDSGTLNKWKLYKNIAGTNIFEAQSAIDQVGGNGNAIMLGEENEDAKKMLTKKNIIDINGDGWPDILRVNASGTWQFFPGNSSGGFSTSPSTWKTPAGIGSTLRLIQNREHVTKRLIDLNGDGYADLVDASTIPWKFYRNNLVDRECRWDLEQCGFENAVNWDAPMADISRFTNIGRITPDGEYAMIWYGLASDTIDINGDNLPDLVMMQDLWAGYNDDLLPDWTVYYNTGNGFDSNPTQWTVPVGCTWNYQAPWDEDRYFLESPEPVHQKILDMNRDGLIDYVYSYDRTDDYQYWHVCLNQGDGFPESKDDCIAYWAPHTIPDVGLPDVTHNSRITEHLCKEQSDNWSICHEQGYNTDTFDVNGDSLLDLVRTCPTMVSGLNCTGKWQAFLGELSYPNNDKLPYSGRRGGGKPDVLVGIKTASGGTIDVTYMSSTACDDTDDVHLKFAVPVVKTITRSDGREGQAGSHTVTTTYQCAEGYYDEEEGEFRGFGRMTTIDEVGTKTITHFYQGDGENAGEPADCIPGNSITPQTDIGALKGRIFCQVVEDSSGNVYSAKENDLNTIPLESGVTFVFTDQQESWLCDGNGNLSSGSGCARNRVRYDFDVEVNGYSASNDFGNIRVVYNDGDPANSLDNVQVYTDDYYLDIDNYIVGLPEHTYIMGFSQSASGSLVTNRRIQEQWVEYDSNGNPTRELACLKNPGYWCDGNKGAAVVIAEHGYDSYGNLVESIDSVGSQSLTPGITNCAASNADACIEYGSGTYSIFPTKACNSLDQCTTSDYDVKTGNVNSTSDPNDQVISFTYDTLGRVLKEIRPYDSATYPTVSYDYHVNLFGIPGQQYTEVKTKSPISNNSNYYIWAKTYFDGLGRTYLTESPGENGTIAASILFNDRGLLQATSNPYYQGDIILYWNETQYDDVGRVSRLINADGTQIATIYDDRTTLVKDENVMADRSWKHGIRTEVDAHGNTIQVDECLGISSGDSGECDNATIYTTTYVYDALGNLLKITDDQGNNTNIFYDTMGRKRVMKDPDSGDWNYSYDTVGNLTQQTDANNQRISFQHDDLHRLTVKDYNTSQTGTNFQDVFYSYDEARSECSSTSYAAGRPDSITYGGSGEKVFCYDRRGREIERYLKIPGDDVTRRLTTSYDSADRVTTISYPSTRPFTILYQYNIGGLLEKVKQDGGENQVFLSDIDYNEKGQITDLNFGNGDHTEYTYSNANGRLSRILTTGIDGKLQDLSYSYDSVGNITFIEDDADFPGHNQRDQGFGYDDLYRLTSATCSGSCTDDGGNNYYPISYAYNSIGNMTFNSRVGNYSHGNMDRTNNNAGPHAVFRVSGGPAGTVYYHYDDNGNMTIRGDWTHEWDYDNRLDKALKSGSPVMEFIYDDGGQRVVKMEDGQSKVTYFSNTFEIREGEEVLHIFSGSQRVATLKGNDIQACLGDIAGAGENPGPDGVVDSADFARAFKIYMEMITPVESDRNGDVAPATSQSCNEGTITPNTTQVDFPDFLDAGVILNHAAGIIVIPCQNCQ